jgi:hypothetical protein
MKQDRSLNRWSSLCLLIVLSASCGPKPVSKPAWSYPQQAGVLAEKAGKVCLEIQNSSLQESTGIRAVNPFPPQTAMAARSGAGDESCATSGAGRDHPNEYSIHLEEGATLQMPAIGIVGYLGDFQKDGDLISADLDGDGQPEYFRACTSTEGIHFTIWTGKALTGKLRWHQYYYLGYDISANCTAAELESPK